MKIKKLIIKIAILTVLLTGCSLWGDKTSARTIKDSSEMPEIVFVYEICHYDICYSRDDVLCDISFCDKNGNFYIAKHTELNGLSTEEFIKEYMAGNMNNQIEFCMTVDSNEVFKNYKKLCKASKNKQFEIVYPGYGPEYIEAEERWYGIYYDREGNVQTLTYHKADAHGSHYSNDECANEIYEWYEASYKNYKVALEEPFDSRRLNAMDELGIKYYKNQLRINVEADVERSEVEEIAEDYDAEIIDFDMKTNEYIFKFNEEISQEEFLKNYSHLIGGPTNWVTLRFYE